MKNALFRKVAGWFYRERGAMDIVTILIVILLVLVIVYFARRI